MVNQHDDGMVEFAFYRPAATSVTLAADFSNWRADKHHMTRDDRGWWRIKLALPPGEYRFKYVVDGSLWEVDYAAYGVEMCKVGGWNSVLYVADMPATETADKPLQLAA